MDEEAVREPPLIAALREDIPTLYIVADEAGEGRT
jgi:hypothetical protein